MSRLCRLKTASHGDDGKWAYDEIVKLRAELAKYRDALAAYKNAPVVAYATTNEDGDLSMLFFDEQEARQYSGDDEPIKLIVNQGE